MPTYAWRCNSCGREFEIWSKIAERDEPQQHCAVPATRILNAPMVAPLFEAYRSVGRGRPWIRTKQEHKDYLRREGYEEVGNDSSVAPPKMSDDEFRHQQAVQLKEIKQSFEEGAAAAKLIE